MRDILFRGKRTDNNKWVYGSPIFQDNYVLIRFWNSEEFEYEEYLVAPETIAQYTGLTDKNGKKIFEGDIVDCWSEGVNAQGTVQQRQDGLWIIYPAWQKHIMWGLCPDEYSNTTVEVIGNIHDNPELIGV